MTLKTDEDKIERIFYRVIEYLGRSDHSVAQIRKYVTQKVDIYEVVGKNDAIEAVMRRLEEGKWIDDERFVAWWVEGRRSSTPRSDKMILLELLSKGVDKRVIENYLENNPANEEALAQKLLTTSRLGSKTDKQLTDFLLRKGFSWQTVKNALANSRANI